MREDSSKNEMQPTGNRQDSYLKDLQRRASMDMLSGLLNRAATERAIKDRLLEMGQGDTCALFIVDLDNFKQVNDMLGHQAGDQAIRQAAEKLSSLFRASDIVGRLGGDEFAAFLGRIKFKHASVDFLCPHVCCGVIVKLSGHHVADGLLLFCLCSLGNRFLCKCIDIAYACRGDEADGEKHHYHVGEVGL